MQQSIGLNLLVKAAIIEDRLRWWGHVQRMDGGRRAKQALNWIPKALSTLLQKSEAVAENGETTAKLGDFVRQSHFSATNCRTYLRQCGQATRDHARSVDRASPGATTLRKTFRIVESLGKRPFS